MDRAATRAAPRRKDAEEVAGYKVAVIGGDGIGPEVLARGAQGRRRRRRRASRPSTTTSAPSHYVRTGEVLPDSVLEELRCRRRHPARSRRAADRLDGGAAGAARAGAAAEAAFRARPVHQPPPVQRRPGLDRRRTPTSSWCGRTPRDPTPAKAAAPAGHALRGRHPGLGQHPPRRRALRPVRVRARRAPAAALT